MVVWGAVFWAANSMVLSRLLPPKHPVGATPADGLAVAVAVGVFEGDGLAEGCIATVRVMATATTMTTRTTPTIHGQRGRRGRVGARVMAYENTARIAPTITARAASSPSEIAAHTVF
ncbi:hypothetical protein GCM10025881_15610 [Pseudolysinimonas kribbensis]|uniref:Secreted protein n=1 Tax=Pseudolysinimonas kribbensis TaxID=433641 RepID=A0ABQ6K295_9MICO|nr:hypothetical protein GCM10025881_15610 [Pseudolysinimonas kribbensis]